MTVLLLGGIMKKCKNCGTKLAKGSAFCVNCGTPVKGKKEKPAKKKHPVRNFFLFIIFVALIGGGVYAYFSLIGFRSVNTAEKGPEGCGNKRGGWKTHEMPVLWL